MALNSIQLIAASALGLMLTACQTTSISRSAHPSPEAAFSALTKALEADDLAGVQQLTGIKANEIGSGDSVQDATDRRLVLNRAAQGITVRESDNGLSWIDCGTDAWTFPIPLKHRSDGTWSFDAATGREEIHNRVIGRNELATLATLRGLVRAQWSYYAMDPDKDGKKSYAARVFSTPGTKDGLYWESGKGEQTSPVGPILAAAETKGYTGLSAGGVPYEGYHYKILDAQPERFVIVAWPASYRKSGVMTFVATERGWLYEKDLGSLTASRAKSVSIKQVRDSWSPVDTFGQ